MTQNALVLLSGGLDSAVAFYWAISQGWKTRGIEFEYHLRPERERKASQSLVEQTGVEQSIIVPVGFMREVSDLPAGMVANPALERAPEGYIPVRNLIFYSICAYHAEILNVRYIVGGHNRTDCESFPDAGCDFFRILGRLLPLGMWSYSETRTETLLPLLELDKAGVINLGNKLGVPFGLTWSCYFDAEQPCGACVSCLERRDAFATSGVPDPLA
jgi:7-cyano-7-deazaguanine synthase